MRIVDLSLPLAPHWRWPLNRTLVKAIERGDESQVTQFTLTTHAFTHIDGPVHMVADGAPLDPAAWDHLIGPAAVLDLSHVGPQAGITAVELEQAAAAFGAPLPAIVVLRTDWPARRDWQTEAFWDDAPYLTADGARWLARHPTIKTVGYDFPQDGVIRELRRRPVANREFVVHHILLGRHVLQLEYLTNLWRLSRPDPLLVILPLHLEQADGAPVRVVAVEGLETGWAEQEGLDTD
jgi:arylformamidase